MAVFCSRSWWQWRQVSCNEEVDNHGKQWRRMIERPLIGQFEVTKLALLWHTGLAESSVGISSVGELNDFAKKKIKNSN